MEMHAKLDLWDLTFIIPVRIDSEERRHNLNVLLEIIERYFNTHVIILEADKTPNYLNLYSNVNYHFIIDDKPIFHFTRYRNQLINFSATPIAAIWDTDAIGYPNQIYDAVEQIRKKKAVVAFPYDGRYYGVNPILSDLFRQTKRLDVLAENVALMNLMHGYYSSGGAFIVDKEKYVKSGGENENFCGWGLEDAERVRRMEIYNLPVYYAPGLLFHLWHPRGINSWFMDQKAETLSRRELIYRCSLKQ